MAHKATLDTLPLELKRVVLYNVDDFETLYGITHASPAYHKAYHTLRNDLLTKVTLNRLKLRGFDFSTPRAFLQVYIGSLTGSRHQRSQVKAVHSAIQSIYDQIEKVGNNAQGHQNEAIKLEYEQCLALHLLLDVIGWEVIEGKPPRDRIWFNLFGPEGLCWESYTHGYMDYHLLAFGSYNDKETIREMQAWINFRVGSFRRLNGGQGRIL